MTTATQKFVLEKLRFSSKPAMTKYVKKRERERRKS